MPRRILIALALMAVALFCSAQLINVDVKVGLFVDTYQPRLDVPTFQSRYDISNGDMEYLIFLKRHSSLSYADLWKMRLKQGAWWWVMDKLGISPDLVMPKFGKDHGPPYGKAWGYWRNKTSGPGNAHPLGKNNGKKGKAPYSDADLLDLARVKTMAKYSGKSPDDVVKAKKSAGGWDSCVKKEKAAKNKGKDSGLDKGKSKGKDTKSSTTSSANAPADKGKSKPKTKSKKP